MAVEELTKNHGENDKEVEGGMYESKGAFCLVASTIYNI